MTIRTEPLYSIVYADDTTLLADFALVTERAAKTTAAALARGGIAPPNATTQAQLAARLVELERRPWALVRRGKTASPAFAPGRTVCTYDTLTSGGDGTCWTAQLPTRLVAPIDGVYRIDATLVMPQGSGRYASIALRKTTKAGAAGGWLRGTSSGLNTVFYTELSRSKLIPLSSGDYVEVFGEVDGSNAAAITPIVIDGEETMSASIEWRRPLTSTPGI
jgi:hypothetical protein